MTHRSIQRRRVEPLQAPHNPDILFGARLWCAKQDGRRNRDERQRQHERRGQRGDHRGRQRPVHAALDAGHREERHEDRHDDERRKEDRTADLLRRMQRDVAPRLAGPLLQVMHDVFGDDDRRVHQQADRDGEPTEGHRVDADAGGAQQKSGQCDRQRQRQRSPAAPPASFRAGRTARRPPGRRRSEWRD